MSRLKKLLIRNLMRGRQKNLSKYYIKEASKNIQEQIFSSELYKNAKKIFTYVSMPREPSTIEIIEQAFNEGKEVYVPKCEGLNMYAVKIYNLDDLRPGKLGILEPDWRSDKPENFSETLTAKEFDLIIVPCLSAYFDGRRLGHGMGYYDRFLADCRKNKNIICLCFYKMLRSDIPMNEDDVYVSKVFTD